MFKRLLIVARGLPAYFLYRISKARHVLDGDISHWCKKQGFSVGTVAFFKLLKFEEFRSVFYYRIPAAKTLSFWIGQGAPALYINTTDIGPGLYFQHGFATIVHAKSIGRNCAINQQVTIGYHGEDRAPIIGNNVSVRAGAKVLGELTLGDDVIVGAGAVVTKSVPPRCIVVGVPAYIIRRDGQPCREQL